MDPQAPNADDLLAHATWLRPLAARLVGWDAADDVLQETWSTALTRPPTSRRALPSWLARVTRNAALQRKRSEKARFQREARSARSEAVTGQAVLERAELHRTLVDEVMALDDPYRTVLLLRWFEDRQPAEIAKLTNTSAATVRSQLKRGHEKLRERLDRRWDGDRSAWMAAFVPLCGDVGRTAATGSGTIGAALLMSLKSNYILPVLALLLLGGGLVLWHLDSGADSSPTDVTELEGVDLPADDIEPESTRGPVLFGRPVEQRAGLGGVAGRVADAEDDALISGARLLLMGTGFGKESVQIRGETGEDGTFHLPEVPAGDGYSLRIEAEGKPGRTWSDVSVRDRTVTRTGTIWLGARLDFEGRVLDEAGRGVPNADVRLHVGHVSWLETGTTELFANLDREPEPAARTLTDRDGVFKLPAQDPGLVTVAARAPGYVPGSLAAVVAPKTEGSRPLVIRLTKGATIAGRVIDGEGRGISGARLAVLPNWDPYSQFHARTVVETQGDGSFYMDTAGREKLMLLATFPGYPITITTVEPPADDVRIVLERGTTLVIRLVSDADGHPIDSASVLLTTSYRGDLAEGWKAISSGITDRTGSVTFDVRPGKIQEVQVTHPEWCNAMWSNDEMSSMLPGMMKGPEDLALKPGRREIEFRMPRFVMVRGRVTDEAGAPVPGARVGKVGGVESKPVLSDANGRYELPIEHTEANALMIHAPGFIKVREDVQVAEGVTEIEKDVTLVRGAVVTGRVVDESGRPVAGAQVRAAPAYGWMLDLTLGPSTGVTGASGGYVLDGVAPRAAWRIIAHRSGYVDQGSEPFKVVAGATIRGKDVVLTIGTTLEVTVESPTGTRLAGAKVRIEYRREDEAIFDRMQHIVGRAPRTSGSDGRVIEENVPVGQATITASHPEYASGTAIVKIPKGADSPLRVTVTLARPMTVAGRVLDAQGRPIKGARVVASKGGVRLWDTTDEQGRFELDTLHEGPVSLRVSAAGSVDKKVEVPGATKTLEIRLRPVDAELAKRREETLARLAELGKKRQKASSDEEREALTRELRAVQQEWRELQGVEVEDAPR